MNKAANFLCSSESQCASHINAVCQFQLRIRTHLRSIASSRYIFLIRRELVWCVQHGSWSFDFVVLRTAPAPGKSWSFYGKKSVPATSTILPEKSAVVVVDVKVMIERHNDRRGATLKRPLSDANSASAAKRQNDDRDDEFEKLLMLYKK